MAVREALERLGKWRQVFASWQLGTRSAEDGECRAVRDHREVTIMLRAEVSALTHLLIERRVFTLEEFTVALEAEAILLDEDYSQKFPGYRSTPEGMAMDLSVATQTMRDLGFPP